MTNLIKAEIYKLQRNKTFWVLAFTITAFSALLHCLILVEWWQLTGTEFNNAGLGEMNAFVGFTIPLFFNLIVSTLAGFYISTEFSQSGVIKNQIFSGNKRSTIILAKFLVFSLGSWVITIVIPLLTAMMGVYLFGHGDVFTSSSLLYLGRALGLFTLQFLSFTAIALWIAFVTEDSGKTILYTLLLSIVMFAIEKLISVPFIQTIYENTFFYQFSEVLKYSITTGEIVKAIVIGVLSLVIILSVSVYMFNKKEIK